MASLDLTNVDPDVVAEVTSGRLSRVYSIHAVSLKGSNGVVFRARNKVIDRDVAIKFYYWPDDHGGHTEPRALADLKSAGVVEVLDAALVGRGWAYFVMPYYASGDLDDLLLRHKFGLREGLRFICLLLQGVADLHAARFLHRDLKPANILVADGGSPMIGDFGSVKRLAVGQSVVKGSKHSMLYRPPESFDSDEYGVPGDIYQLGIVMFQVMGGSLPYEDGAYLGPRDMAKYKACGHAADKDAIVSAAIAKMARSGRLLRMDSLPFFVPAKVRRIIGRATSPNPGDRYPVAGDFMAAINNVYSRVPDWRVGSGLPYVVDGSDLLRIGEGADGECWIEMKRGPKWRRLPGFVNGPKEQMLSHIQERCS